MGPMAWLIVSCQICQLLASLPAPQLMVRPRSLYYWTGQSLSLTCSRSGFGKGKKFIFFKDKIKLSSSEWKLNDGESHYFSQLNISNSGEYSCKYCVTSEKQPIHSLESNSVRITVLEQPPLPVFSISPRQEIYISPEVINLTCSVSDKRKVSKILFFKNKKYLTSLERSLPPFTFSLPLLSQGVGNYSCSYWVVDSEWKIPSQESNIISISVTDPPPQPVLKVDPPAGEVSEGDHLHFTCKTDTNTTEKRFHFYRDGIEITSASKGFLWCAREPGNASSALIFQAKPNQTGQFACSYEEKRRDRWVSSPWSQEVSVTAWAQHPYLALEHARWVIPFLIVMVLLIFGCRERALKYQQESKPAESIEATESGNRGTLELQTVPFHRPKPKKTKKNSNDEALFCA